MKDNSMNDKCIEYFKMILAGKKIEVECNYRFVFSMCHRYLAEFEQPDFIVRASLDEIVSRRVPINEELINIPGIAMRYADEYIEPYVVYQKIADQMIQYDTLLMHGAVIAKDNNAYMFMAPSNVGKSTRAKLWLEEYQDSIIVNGDKPLIKITEDNAIACGTPWCGKEGWNTNIMVPLRAILMLERADDNRKSEIEEIGLAKAFPSLLSQTYHPSNDDFMRKTIHLLKKLDGKVSFYRFRSTPTLNAIRLAYETVCPRQ